MRVKVCYDAFDLTMQDIQNLSTEIIKNETEMEIATEILSMLFLLMLAISCGHFLKKSGHKYLQEAGLTTLIGMGAGYTLRLMSIEST